MGALVSISRENLSRGHYARLGIPKKFVRWSTKADESGSQHLDLQLLAAFSNRPFIQVVNAISRAGFPAVDLMGLQDRLRELGLVKEINILWKQGLEHPDQAVRDEFTLICHALVGKLAAQAGVPVFALTITHFKKIEIAELGKTLLGLYQYYSLHTKRDGEEVVDFMLGELGYGKFQSLPFDEQLKTLKEGEIIHWGKVPLMTQCWLIERLAVLAETPVFALKNRHFKIVIPAINKSLNGFFDYYLRHSERNGQAVMDFIMERLGYDRFDLLSVWEQIEVLRGMDDIYWNKIPLSTQRWLVERLADVAECPVDNLITIHFIGHSKSRIQPLEIPELGKSLMGLHQYYNKHADRGEQNTISFMLGKLDCGTMESLSIAEQITILSRRGKIHWANVPLDTQRYLVEGLAKTAGVSVYDLTSVHFCGDGERGIKPIIIPELGKNLSGFYVHYVTISKGKRQDVVGFILEELGYGLPPFNAAGRLFASGQDVDTPAKSLLIQLRATRKLVGWWRRTNPGSPIFGITLGRQRKILDDPWFLGVKKIFLGAGSNYFGLSLRDLICLAYQHIPLDELDNTFSGELNYLVPSMFKYNREDSNGASHNGGGIVGYYRERGGGREVATLGSILERSIEALQDSRDAAVSEKDLFDPKWLETQKRGLVGIAQRIQERRLLPAPLRYALGLQGRLTDPRPKLLAVNDLEGLNRSQQYAVRMMLEEGNPLVMVHGPAGSGKTHIVVETIKRLLGQDKKVLYATPTHKAADVFLEKVDKDAGFAALPVLRLGVSDAKFEGVGQKYWMQDRLARGEFRRRRQEQKGSLFVGTIAAGVHFLIDQEQGQIRRDLFSECLERGIRINRDIDHYDVVIIDEASMASKPEVYSALALAKRAVIIGDHVQLEPFPVDRAMLSELGLNEREQESVQRSLLEELMFANYPHVLLEQNYRAVNPVMIVLASRVFYDERIRINQASPYFTIGKVERQEKYPPDSLKIVDTSALPYAQKEEAREGTSYYNYKEAKLAVEEAKRLMGQGFTLDDIAFITPYMAQVNLLKRELAREFSEISADYLDRWVSTFDGFQGDENKCVIISFVRSNEKQPPETGFVGNYHRVNVGITRAQERMILIGDWSTLKKSGTGQDKLELSDNLSLHTRHIFEELELQVAELEQECRAKIIRLSR